MKIYRGIFRGHGDVKAEDMGNAMEQVVLVEDLDACTEGPLDLYLDVRNHSPTGLSWGYGGSGPNQLALALLIDAGGPGEDSVRATRIYQLFCKALISKLPQDQGWIMSSSVINCIAEGIDSTVKRSVFGTA